MSISNNISILIPEVNKDSDDLLHQNPDMSMGKRLKEARDDLGLSQNAVRDRLKLHGIKMSQSAIAQLEGDASKTSGNSAALAAVLGVNALWLETGRGPKRPDGAPQSQRMEIVSTARPQSNEIEIPQYTEIGGSMGRGVLLRDQPGEIQCWRVTPEWIEKNIRSHTGVQNLAIVTGFGDSMRGMFNPGDPLLVDCGVRTVEFDAVYFFRVGSEGFIKRLQRIPGEGLIAISENKAYRDWTIKKDMDFEVFARVIKVWNGTDF